MVAGLAFLGAIAATLASFLGLADAGRSTSAPSAPPALLDSDAVAGTERDRGDVPDDDDLRADDQRGDAPNDVQARELAELRREITRLAALIDERQAPDGTRDPTP
jgi:hypothetical protein